MAVVTTFLVNLLCSIVSCDPKFPEPEIGSGVGLGFGGRIISPSASSSIFSRITTTGAKLPLTSLPFDPVVATGSGGVRGYSLRTMGNRKVWAFEGIPYAQPPLGRLRFKAPKEVLPWSGIREAKAPGADCLQLSLPRGLRVLGSEDCLTLNIYTPTIPGDGRRNNLHFASKLLPVVIVLHGGGYYWGSGSELGPSYLLDKDVILVTVNFRLGVLGFLSTGDNASPGNYGLKDQAMAIRWIYENIAAFGGNSNAITLMGQGSGGASAHLHLLSNLSSPHIQGGVSLSGSAFSHWAIKSRANSRRMTISLAKAAHCPTTQGSQALVTCLRARNPVEIVAAQLSLLEFSPFPYTLFAPVIEQQSSEAFLTRTPKDFYDSGEVAGKPWIFSHTGQEGYLGLRMLSSVAGAEGKLRSHWDELAPIYMDYRHTSLVNGTTSQLSKFYFGHKSPQVVKESKIAAVFGDRLTLAGVDEGIQAHSRVAPTYAYIFGFKGKYSLDGSVSQAKGVGSGEDLYYYFNSSRSMPGFKRKDLEELELSHLMTTFLANFARTGQPLLPRENGVYSGLWDPVQPSSVKFLQLNREIKMINQPFKKRISFWRKLASSNPLLLHPLLDDG